MLKPDKGTEDGNAREQDGEYDHDASAGFVPDTTSPLKA
jgi:hypothetical protein